MPAASPQVHSSSAFITKGSDFTFTLSGGFGVKCTDGDLLGHKIVLAPVGLCQYYDGLPAGVDQSHQFHGLTNSTVYTVYLEFANKNRSAALATIGKDLNLPCGKYDVCLDMDVQVFPITQALVGCDEGEKITECPPERSVLLAVVVISLFDAHFSLPACSHTLLICLVCCAILLGFVEVALLEARQN